MESIKKAMLAMKNDKDAANDNADQLENTYLEKKSEMEKVGRVSHLPFNIQLK